MLKLAVADRWSLRIALRALLLIGVLASQSAAAAELASAGSSAEVASLPGLQIDSSQSRAGFSVRVAWVRTLPGQFDQIEGAIARQLGQRTLSVDVRLATSSLTMADSDHAEWAQSPEFFDAARHPWIRFFAESVPESLLVTGGDLSGQLSLRGIHRQVTFSVQPTTCARPGIDCPVEAFGELKRSEFGMQARRFVVADKVRLNLSIRVAETIRKR
ncbi:MAG: YceI family protein [Pseudomarimonas sp.]